MKRGIVRMYFLPGQDARYVKKFDNEVVIHNFMDFDLDEHIPVRIHIPDFCMQIDVTPSGVHISYHSDAYLAQE